MAKNQPSLPPADEKPKADRSGSKPDWAVELVHGCCRVALKLITTGNAGILMVLGIVLSLIWHLTSADLKDVLKSLLGNQWLAFAGWGFFLIALLVGGWIIKALRTLHERQTDQLTKLHGEEMKRVLDEHRHELDRINPAARPLAGSAHGVLLSPQQAHQRNPPQAE